MNTIALLVMDVQRGIVDRYSQVTGILGVAVYDAPLYVHDEQGNGVHGWCMPRQGTTRRSARPPRPGPSPSRAAGAPAAARARTTASPGRRRDRRTAPPPGA